MNLSFNGVSTSILAAFMKTGLEDSVKELTTWTSPNAMYNLWNAVDKAGGVATSRFSRFSTGQSRALGFSRRQWGRSEDSSIAEDRVTDDAATVEAQTGRNPYSGGRGLSYDIFMNC